MTRALGTGTAFTAAAGLCLAALPGSAQAVTAIPLATSATYAVLAGSGITNTGVTTVTGDVGSSAITSESGLTPCPGVTCLALTGTNHNDLPPNDAATVQAKTDLGQAYVAAGIPAPTITATDLGGLTLVPGVYTSATGTFGMTGTLTLDAQNDPTAVFIFQTATTLVTDITGSMLLINGADACNVYWRIGSAATLATSSNISGTIMAHDDISLGAGVTVDGRLLAGAQPSQAGAVTLNNDTITASACAAVISPPPTATPTATPTSTPTATPTPPPTPTSTATSPPTSSPSAAAKRKSATTTPGAGARGNARTAAVAGDNATSGGAGANAGAGAGAQVTRVPLGGVQSG